MMKKIISSLCMLYAVSGFATNESNIVGNPAPYIGGSVGLVVNTDNHDGHFRGLPFMLSAGYGGLVNSNFYLAGEIFSTLFTPSLDDKGSVKSTYNYGISVIPGFIVSDHVMTFLRLGIVKTHFSQLNSLKTGAQFGVGLQTNLSQSLDLRGEYDYISYNGSLIGDQFSLGLIYKFI